MTVILNIGKMILNIIYVFFKCLKTQDKIIYVSRQSNHIPLEYKMISSKIKNVKQIFLCKVIGKSILGKIQYCFYILYCMLQFATAKVCITDGYSIPVSMLKHKKNLKIIQLWHAAGAVKKFGYQTIGKADGSSMDIAKAMNMHKNYDYVVCCSENTMSLYEEAFHISKDRIKVIGMPRIDYILQDYNMNIEHEIIDYYHLDRDKKTIVYVPTFRKNKVIPIEELLQEIEFEKYNLIIKLHPLDQTVIYDERVIKANKYYTWDIVRIADYLITDYSALSIEVSLLHKKMFFWLYDIEEYKENKGLNIDLFDEFPEYVFTSAKKLVNCLEKDYDMEAVTKYKQKYIDVEGSCTDKIVQLIYEIGGFTNVNTP